MISLPERNEVVRKAVAAAWDFLEAAEAEADVAAERRKSQMKEALKGVSDAEVWEEIQIRRGDLQGEMKSVKAAELETLLATHEEAVITGPTAFSTRGR